MTKRLVLVSDFNLDHLNGVLKKKLEPSFLIEQAPFGPVLSHLSNEGFWKEKKNAHLFVWTQPQVSLRSFQKLIYSESVTKKEILSEVDQFSEALLNQEKKGSTVLMASWVLPSHWHGLGPLEYTSSGWNRVVHQMNERLAQNLEGASQVFLLNSNHWIQSSKDYAQKMWYLAKIPFSIEVFQRAAQDVSSFFNASLGKSRRLVVLDLDQTLWGGILGEVGWKNLHLGGHDHLGEAFLDFQRALKGLRRRGILLGIASKNEEEKALEAIQNHPEMILRKSDFSGWKINWKDKAKNIAELTRSLNLGLSSVVFIDDHPAERARVAEAFPEVFVPDWPSSPTEYTDRLRALSCFDSLGLTTEDQNRAQMMEAEKERTETRQSLSLSDWLKSLEIKIQVERLSSQNLKRAAQLLNKTNQMNLRTRRLSEAELMESSDHDPVWTFRYQDRFGDAGLTGLVSLKTKNGVAQIQDFLLSCRVMGRGLEEAMLFHIIEYVKKRGLEEIHGEYRKTERNSPCLEYFQKLGWQKRGDLFCFNLREPFLLPSYVFLEEKGVLRKGQDGNSLLQEL